MGVVADCSPFKHSKFSNATTLHLRTVVFCRGVVNAPLQDECDGDIFLSQWIGFVMRVTEFSRYGFGMSVQGMVPGLKETLLVGCVYVEINSGDRCRRGARRDIALALGDKAQ